MMRTGPFYLQKKRKEKKKESRNLFLHARVHMHRLLLFPSSARQKVLLTSARNASASRM